MLATSEGPTAKPTPWGLNKRTSRRIVTPHETDIEQLMKERVGKSTACINDWPSQNHS
jgi:hypothetical protein